MGLTGCGGGECRTEEGLKSGWVGVVFRVCVEASAGHVQCFCRVLATAAVVISKHFNLSTEAVVS